MSLLSVLPVAVGQAWAASEETALAVCRKLVDEAREVSRLLRTVSDRESGDAAAAELKPRMEYMRTATEKLGRLPLGSGEELRELEQLMRDLTHVTQGYMPAVQRLVEVNAYGAEELMGLFRYYKMSAEDTSGNQPETPLARAYAEWCDAVEDMLYLLRRAQNQETARAVANELKAACRKVEQKAQKVEDLQAGLSPQQLVSERVPAARMQRLQHEVQTECSRLESNACFHSPDLEAMLQSCSRVCR